MPNKKKEIWTIDELVSLTETVQSKEIEFNGKVFPIQWCELTEAEEPKVALPSEALSEEEKNAHFTKMAGQRVTSMIQKANLKNPEGKTLDEEDYPKLPTTLRYRISNAVMGVETPSVKADF